MERALYVSDLDGTLLDREGNLTQYSKAVVRRMTEEGHLFTVATARTLQSSQDLIYYMGLKLPVILNNGATIYDPVGEDYLQVHSIPLTSMPRILWALEYNGLCGFLHTLKDNEIAVYYRSFRNDWDPMFYSHRMRQYHGRVYQDDDLIRPARERIPICMAAYGQREQLERAGEALSGINSVMSNIYNDGYTGYSFIDIFPSTASKANGMLTIQRLTGATRLVAFGDSFNDLSMLLAADYSYVPANGLNAAKNLATQIIDRNDRDGVAHFLAGQLGWE